MKWIDLEGARVLVTELSKVFKSKLYNPENFISLSNTEIDDLFKEPPKILYLKLLNGYGFKLSKVLKSWDKVVYNGVEYNDIQSGKSGIYEIHNAVARDTYDMTFNFGGNDLLELYGYIDTSNTTDMKYMFNDAFNMTKVDLSSFITSQVKDMSYMFNACNSLKELDVSKLVTSNVTSFHYMFGSCGLNVLDCNNFDTRNCTDFEGMFINNKSLHTLYIDNLDMSKYTSIYAMFNGNVLTKMYVRGKDVPNRTIVLLSYVLDNAPDKVMYVYDASKHAGVTASKITFEYV